MRSSASSCLTFILVLSGCARPLSDASQCTAADGGTVLGCGGTRDERAQVTDAAPDDSCDVTGSDAGMVVTCGASSIVIPPGVLEADAGGDPQAPDHVSVIEGNVTIENSLDIERLERTGATTITGALIIGGEPSSTNGDNGLADLSGLHNLMSVGGTLVISFSGTSLHGLEQLASVGGLDIANNPNLVDISALEGLTSVSERLRLSGNPVLTEISFPALSTAGALEITDHDLLTSISLPLLEALSPTAGMVIAAAPALTTLDLPRLESPGSALVLQGLSSLGSVSFPELVSVSDSEGAGLRLESLGATSVSLPQLANVGGEVVIRDNAALPELALPALTEARGLVLHSNATLATVSLPLLEGVRDGLNVDSNAALTALSSPALTSVGSVAVHANAALAGISMPLLSSATEYHVDACPELQSLVLPLLGGAVCWRVHDNAALPQCAVDAVEAQLETNTCPGESVDNAGTPCP